MYIHGIVLFHDMKRKQWYHFCVKMNVAVGCMTVTQSPQALESSDHEPWATVGADSEFALHLMRLQFSAYAHRQSRKHWQGLNYKGALSREEQCV